MINKFCIIIVPFYILYSVSFILYLIYGYKFIDFKGSIMILDNVNFSYIEYISNIKLISDESEKAETPLNETKTKTKLLLGFYKKGLYCQCYNNQSKSLIIKDTNICDFFGCGLKFDKSNNMNYSIYKWKNNSLYVEVSKYYFHQGINPKTKKCDEKLGFMSCGYYDDINGEICTKRELMNCPYNNIIFNELNLFLSLNNKDNIKINENISLLDIMPYAKMNLNNESKILFNHSLEEFLKENDIYSNYKHNDDKANLIPIYNNIIKYNEKISTDNVFTKKYHFDLYKLFVPDGVNLDTNSFSYGLIVFISGFYFCSKVFFEFIIHIISISFSTNCIFLIIEKKYNELYREYYDNCFWEDMKVTVFYFLKLLIEYPFFFKSIYCLRKINKIYDGHKWNETFKNALKIEIIFRNINLIILILYCIPVFVFLFLYLKLEVLKFLKN